MCSFCIWLFVLFVLVGWRVLDVVPAPAPGEGPRPPLCLAHRNTGCSPGCPLQPKYRVSTNAEIQGAHQGVHYYRNTGCSPGCTLTPKYRVLTRVSTTTEMQGNHQGGHYTPKYMVFTRVSTTTEVQGVYHSVHYYRNTGCSPGCPLPPKYRVFTRVSTTTEIQGAHQSVTVHNHRYKGCPLTTTNKMQGVHFHQIQGVHNQRNNKLLQNVLPIIL